MPTWKSKQPQRISSNKVELEKYTINLSDSNQIDGKIDYVLLK